MLLTTVMMIVKQSHQMGFMNTMMMMLTRENTNIPGLGCFACRHSCCFFTNCSKSECPLCHVKVPLCHENCPCNIFTSDVTVAPPWLENPVGDDDNDDNDSENNDKDGDDEVMKYCGPEQCKIMCNKKEYCANTGKPDLCESVKCISFNV